mgnify:CR=1 FL=1
MTAYTGLIQTLIMKEDNLNEYKNRHKILLKKINFKYEILNIPHPTNIIDNCIITLTDFNIVA